MSKSTSQWNNKFLRVATWEKTFFCVPLWWKLRKHDNHHSILTCLQTAFLSRLKKVSWTLFLEITSFSSNPSPSFNRWIKRISVLEAWTSYTYPWWTMYKTRSALFFLKRGFRQNWGLSHSSKCRKFNRRNLVLDSHTEQFLRSRGLRQKQALPHLVSEQRKTSWGSLLE